MDDPSVSDACFYLKVATPSNSLAPFGTKKQGGEKSAAINLSLCTAEPVNCQNQDSCLRIFVDCSEFASTYPYFEIPVIGQRD